jgi:hypothetical protein
MIKCNSCNIEKEEIHFSIRYDRTTTGKYRKTCKSCKNANQRKNYKKYKENNPFLARHSKMKAACKQRNIQYNLDEKYLEQIWTGFCPITGVKLIWASHHTDKNNPDLAELDRFNPSLGYIKGNVSWISRRMNHLKNDGSIEEFTKILNWMKEWKPPKINHLPEKNKVKREDAWNKGLKYNNEDIKGEKNPNSKLTLEDVREIRKKFENKRGDYIRLAKEYSVTPGTIRKIINNITWKDEIK